MTGNFLKKVIVPIFLAVGIVLAGCIIFKGRLWTWIFMSAAIIILGGFFIFFERKNSPAEELAVTAVFTAISIAGRLAFAMVPAFKPCGAVIILAGIYFGGQCGFMVGALTPLISNLYFGQGMWTPIQMLAWAITGLIAGFFSTQLRKNRVILIAFGVLAGAGYSVTMDLWSVLWADNGFTLSRFLALTVTSALFTVMYAVSNAVFLLLLIKPCERIFTRLKQKYNIGKIKIRL